MPTALTLASDSSSDSEDEISTTKETRGTVDKFSALATLDDSDYDILMIRLVSWPDTVQAAQVLLQEVNPLLEGLHRLTLGCVRNFDVVSGENILKTFRLEVYTWEILWHIGPWYTEYDVMDNL